MPLLSDRELVRRLLRRDAVWAAYALGDLGPNLWPHTRWHQSGEEVALVLHAYHVPILWAAGALTQLLSEISDEARYSVQIRPSALPALERQYRTSGLKKMWRMTVAPEDFRPAGGDGRRPHHRRRRQTLRPRHDDMSDLQHLTGDVPVCSRAFGQ